MDALPPSLPDSIPTGSSPFHGEGGSLPLSLAAYNAEVAKRHREIAERDTDAIRERCKSFAGFVKEAWHVLEPETRYSHNWHIDAICAHLEAITFGRMKPRLIINVPPGSMKSLLITVMWQAWMWGPCGMPAKRFVTTSFELGNVERDTGKTRDLITSEWYQRLWPTTLVRSQRLDFANSSTGNRLGVAFVALMGKRGDVLVIDDPHSLDGAESEVQRSNSVKRFLEGGKSRVNDRKKSAIVIVMQRIHTDDLSGAVLAEELGYDHLMIPMEFEQERSRETTIGWHDPRDPNYPPTPGVEQGEGVLMDPRRFGVEEADEEKKQPYSWSGQYQQTPVPREGNLFNVDKIGIINASPGGGVVVRGWDLAGTKKKKSAWSVGLKLRRVPGQLIVEDVIRLRGAPFEVKRKAREAADEDGIACKQSFPLDPGQAGIHQRDDYADALEGCNFVFSPETGDKEFRAQGIASQVDADKVVMVRASWNAAFKEELRSFPNTLFKDQVDAFSRAYMTLLKTPEVPENAAPETVDGEVETNGEMADEDFDPWV